jgi:hypothetical protein
VSHGQPSARAHCSTARCPPVAALAQESLPSHLHGSHAQPRARSQLCCSSCPARAARSSSLPLRVSPQDTTAHSSLPTEQNAEPILVDSRVPAARLTVARRAGRAVVRAVGETVTRKSAGCGWRCAGDLHRAVGGQRPCAHAISSYTIASSASSNTPVGGHHGGRRRAGAAHSTDVHPPATAAYAIAAEVAAPSLPLQPPPLTPAAGAQALGSTGLTALRSRHRTVTACESRRGPQACPRPLLYRRQGLGWTSLLNWYGIATSWSQRLRSRGQEGHRITYSIPYHKF